MMKNESVIGVVIVGALAALYFGSKRSNTIPQVDPLDEVIIRNVTRQVNQFSSRISQISNLEGQIGRLNEIINRATSRGQPTTGGCPVCSSRPNSQDCQFCKSGQTAFAEQQQLLNKKEELLV